MTKMFGIPMQNIMVTLLIITGFCLLSVAFIAWRQRVIFLMGLRNIPRRRAQTVLIVFGLMLATVIITSALTIGDTLAYSIKGAIYDHAGPVDLAVVRGQEENGRVAQREGAEAYFDRATYETLRGRVAGAASVDGLAPLLVEQVALVNQTAQLSEPVVTLTGIDAADAGGMGGVAALGGGTIDLAGLKEGEIVVNEWLAKNLAAKPGDQVTLFARNQPYNFTVARVARDGGLSGVGYLQTQGAIQGAVLLPARAAQTLAGQDGRYNTIVVSAKGDVEGGLRNEAAARDALRAATAGAGLGVDPIKRRNIDEAEAVGNVFTSFFLIFGLFAIAAGVMLIFLIFVMLAAERRGEMGMARAVGTKRRGLIQSFVAEGAAYDLAAAGVGALLGVAVAFGITGTMARLLGSDELNITPRVEPRSLVIAYCLGVVVTFITIFISSWRVSRLNIVAAIRDLEDQKRPGGGWRGLAFGILGIALGALLVATAGTAAAPFTFGVSLIILAATLILRRLRLPSRLIYTLAGAALLVFWALPAGTSERLFGRHEGDVEMFFISGIMMVAGAVLVLINNGEFVITGLNALGGVARRFLPAIKMATAYPLASRFRTGLTLYMFALIIFVLVVMASIQVNFDKLFNDPARTTGGWDVVGQTLPANPIAGGDVRGALAGAPSGSGVNVGDIRTIGGAARILPAQVLLQQAGSTRAPGRYPLNGVDDDWLATTTYHLQARAEGYADDAAVWRAVRSDPNLVVIDIFAFPGNSAQEDIGNWKVEDISQTAPAFAPKQLELRSPTTGRSRTVTIVGVTDTFINGTFGMFANQQLVTDVFGPQPVTSYFFKLQPGVDDRAMARGIEAALLAHGMQAESIHAIVAENNRINAGFFALLKGFIGLGLVVGIAALGVVAFRAVVERRQQIGMLRAIGFGRGMVSGAFLLESLFITAGGVAAGVATAVILSRNLFRDGQFGNTAGASFIVPWDQIALFAGIALVAALLMTIIPSRQAGGVEPAEALRFE
ncbi:MAG: FtsX-like permease family protein [Chloroflexota bacterium]|nr:FtsX-like permease family protein [Chloroflexota bacterium]